MLDLWLTTLLLQGTSTTSSSAASGATVPSDEAESAEQQHQATDASLSPDEAAGAVPAHRQHHVSGAASPLGELSADSGGQQHEVILREPGAVSESTTGRPALERLSSGAKRHANRDWSDLQSPLKRQELDQPSTSASQPAAGDTAGSDTTMTHAVASDTASQADDKETGDAADSDTAMTHALASDIASAADDKGQAADSDTAMTHAWTPDVASAADDKGRAADDDSAVSDAAQQEDMSAGIQLMTDAHDSDADSADRVMLDLNDEMEGLTSSAADSSEEKPAQSRSTGVHGLSPSSHPLCPLPHYMSLSKANFKKPVTWLKHIGACLMPELLIHHTCRHGHNLCCLAANACAHAAHPCMLNYCSSCRQALAQNLLLVS